MYRKWIRAYAYISVILVNLLKLIKDHTLTIKYENMIIKLQNYRLL